MTKFEQSLKDEIIEAAKKLIFKIEKSQLHEVDPKPFDNMLDFLKSGIKLLENNNSE